MRLQEKLARKFGLVGNRKPVNRAKRKELATAKPTKYDPTRTGTLRKGFEGQLSKRFRKLKGKILKLIVVDDAFGLKGAVTNENPYHDERGRFASKDTGAGTQPVSDFTPKDAVKELGRVWLEGVKFVGGKIEHGVHAAEMYAMEKLLGGGGPSKIDKLPKPLAMLVRGVIGTATFAVKGAFAGYTLTQKLAERVAIETGKTPEQAARLRSSLATWDALAFKPLALMTHHSSSTVQGMTWAMGVGTAGYLASSAISNPVATAKAAYGLVRDAVGAVAGRAKEAIGKAPPLMNASDGETIYQNIKALDQAYSDHNYDEWYLALVAVAADELKDGPTAISLANELYTKHPHAEHAMGMPVENTRWKASSSPEKVKEFQRWVKTQLDEDVRGYTSKQLWDAYIKTGYKRGAGRSFDDVRNPTKYGGDEKKMSYYRGTKDEFLRSSFAQPQVQEKVEMLASRAYDDLNNITEDMSTRMTRTLVDGLVKGDNPRDIAKELNEEVDLGANRSLVVARTEIMRAHAEGQLDALENLGVEELEVEVEFLASDNACPECAEMMGTIVSIKDARGMIPFHPNCKCCWIPHVPEENEEEPVKNRYVRNHNPNHDPKTGQFISGFEYATTMLGHSSARPNTPEYTDPHRQYVEYTVKELTQDYEDKRAKEYGRKAHEVESSYAPTNSNTHLWTGRENPALVAVDKRGVYVAGRNHAYIPSHLEDEEVRFRIAAALGFGFKKEDRAKYGGPKQWRLRDSQVKNFNPWEGDIAQIQAQERLAANSFCATGPGGGVDPSCGKDDKGGSDDESDAQDAADTALDDKRQDHDDKVQEKRDNEDEKLANKREKEDEKLAKAREKEDEKLEAAYEKSSERLDAKGDAIQDKIDSLEAKKEEIEEKRSEEDDALAKVRQEADDKLQEEWDAEDEKINEGHSADDDKAMEARSVEDEKYHGDTPADIIRAREVEDAKIDEQRAQEAKEREEARAVVSAKILAKQEKEDAAIQAKRDAEDEKLEQERTKLEQALKDLEEEKEKVTNDYEELKAEIEDKRSEEDGAISDRRDEEDTKIQDRRDMEDDKLAKQREAEDKKSGKLERDKEREKAIAAYLKQLEESGRAAKAEERVKTQTKNVFCPTGEGGGVDPSCSPNSVRVETSIKKMVEIQAQHFEKSLKAKGYEGWNKEFTEKGFKRNWNKTLKGLEPDKEKAADIQKSVDEAYKLYDIPKVDIFVRKQTPEEKSLGENAHWSEGFIVVSDDVGDERKYRSEVRPLSWDRKSTVKEAYPDLVAGLIVHELGHKFHDDNPESLQRARALVLGGTREEKRELSSRISSYGASHPQELVAEAYAMYKHPDFKSTPKETQDLVGHILHGTPTSNVFCPTGSGGGVDPSCGRGPQGSKGSIFSRLRDKLFGGDGQSGSSADNHKANMGQHSTLKGLEHYTPVKSIKEAVNHAKRNLGMKEVDLGKDVDAANHLLAGLTALKSQGIPIPSKVKFDGSEEAASLTGGGTLTFGNGYVREVQRLKSEGPKDNKGWLSTQDAHHLLVHEIGHHEHQLAKESRRSLAHDAPERQLDSQERKAELFKEALTKVGHEMSGYVKHSGEANEYIAEMYTGLMLGKQYSPEAHHYFKEMGGHYKERN